MADHLRLLCDHDLDPGISDWLKTRASGRHKVVTAREKGWDELLDEELIDRATEENRILITADQKFRRSSLYQICTHAGILVLSSDLSEASLETIIARLKDFLQSGHRQRVRHAIVTLERERARLEDARGVELLDLRKIKRPRRYRRRR